MDNEIKNWPKLLYDELPNIVKPLLALCIFLLAFLLIGKTLNLNDSLWQVSKEGLFNSALFLGVFSLVFGALNKAPLELRKSYFSKKYPVNKLNVDYFLGQIDGSDKVYLFELSKQPNKKLWIENLPTKRQLWPGVNAIAIKHTDKTVSVKHKSVKLDDYPNNQDQDGIIDILNPGFIDNFFLLLLSVMSYIILLILF